MSGLLLELRRQIAHNRRKAAYEERMRASAQEKPQKVFSQKTKETKPDTEIQPEVQERKVNVVSREDFLLSQIDEFRERAKQLQSLLDSRETEAQELQTLVDERQEKADALGQILEERQKKADGFTAEVEKQIDRLIGKVSAKMEEIEVSMKEDVADGKRLNEEKAKELKDSLAQIEEQLTTAKTEISEKVHTENVKCYRNISDLFRSMDIPVRTLECCSGDLADLKVKSCDVEAWSPRQKKYFEVGSCSNLGDAQARRLKIRVKGKDGNKYFANTLNNTVVAPPRMLIAFLENNLNADGSVSIPKVLQPYMGGKEKLVPDQK